MYIYVCVCVCVCVCTCICIYTWNISVCVWSVRLLAADMLPRRGLRMLHGRRGLRFVGSLSDRSSPYLLFGSTWTTYHLHSTINPVIRQSHIIRKREQFAQRAICNKIKLLSLALINLCIYLSVISVYTSLHASPKVSRLMISRAFNSLSLNKLLWKQSWSRCSLIV